MTFQERLLLQMERRNWKQVDLCRAANISSSQATHLMNGRTRDPSLSTAAKIANALDISMDYLAGLTDNPAGMSEEELNELRLNADARALLDGFSKLPPEGKRSINEQMEFQLSKNGAQGPDSAVCEVA